MLQPSLLLILSLPVFGKIVIIDGDPVVKTSLGDIRGSTESGTVRAFLGVPYAHAPVKDRRFKVPEILTEKWEKEIEAKRMASTCYQTPDASFPGFFGSEMWNPPTALSEDCLNLNIWVPENPNGNVLVWIFGGGFFSGSPSLRIYDGSVLAATTRAIVVNINYRVGPFGFLYLGDESPAPGNMGLLDQQAALKWINKHISSFGGDSQKVTLIGESAGAASVTSHLTAPDSYELFQKIIANSGSITHPWATMAPEVMLETSLRLAKDLNCTEREDAISIHECLTKLSAEEIQSQNDANWPSHVLLFPFVPIRKDKNFFKGNVYDRLSGGDMKKDASVIIGAVKDEGTFWLPYYFSGSGFVFDPNVDANSQSNASPINEQQYEDSIRSLMTYFGNSKEAEKILVDTYKTPPSEDKEALRLRDGVAQLVGDLFFTCSVKEYADSLLSHINGDVYTYYFVKRSSANPWPKWMGVMHGYEIEYEFGLPFHAPSLYDTLSFEF
ncbi:unnamed protein product [Heligmosomoides polygyrus]|uniref:Carboxylic ester hydrolase n=1 Tax=Heligmosomoides polygyrus TaxID=6339 RepID=A0A183G5M8_HELPZ|nr:unnamed protein product [Heligmosomoides polygyrus]